jgi:lysophospholipase L1-like esterase
VGEVKRFPRMPALALAGLGAVSAAHAPATANETTDEVGQVQSIDTARPIAAPKAMETEEGLKGARYVAIGSSFAAGPMLPPGKPPTPGAPVRCGQSKNNYPTLLAERFGMDLVDRTCSGARTEHVLGPWGDIPPQIASVNAATRLVTVTIGGNDLSYIGNLFSATCIRRASELAAAGFEAKPCGSVREPAETEYLRVETQLNEIARRIREAAPRARLVFVQYLTPLPKVLCAETPVSAEDAAIVRRIGVHLAEITGKVAQENRALVVEMNQSSATHTPCDAQPWMIGAPKGYDGKQGLQWHLNLAGMKATADGIAYWLNETGVEPKTPQPTTGEKPAETPPATEQAPDEPRPPAAPSEGEEADTGPA